MEKIHLVFDILVTIIKDFGNYIKEVEMGDF